ncbi:hypothetical protein [Methanoregula sp.]|uniref:tetratricopeptide repeat protein n=1 Tax=Methanoregula sp. TaxID=2052170 RepID=UPI002631D1FF|nr:hypothetical protein [Methanoregula sp.]MDD5142707.1 hypothetical protein [Methanoregula sp.]
MTMPGHEVTTREAFRLFEDGRYQESLAVCNRLLEAEKDPALEVLAATNLYHTGRFEDAEVFFRDLAVRMPDSSYVHSYLGKVLEARGDDEATSEYAAAVRLDPANQDALRSYAGYLLSRNDFRGALPLLFHLTKLAGTEKDTGNLVRALIGCGRGDEALAILKAQGGIQAFVSEYIEALLQVQDFRAASEHAHSVWQSTHDPAMLRISLDACARYDTATALETYASVLQEQPDGPLFFDYVHALHSAGRPRDALKAVFDLLTLFPDEPEYRLAECDLLGATGDTARALERYGHLVQDELAAKTDMVILGRIIGGYRRFLTRTLPADEAERHLLKTVSRDLNVVSLLETARFYEETGNPAMARSWYYRAYRADFLAGGPDYALFLAANGEERECEKVMIYILSNVRKGSDLVRVAALIVEGTGRMHTMKRLMELLIRKLEDQAESLTTDGRELLANAFFHSATNALEAADYPACKFLCLRGIDALPAHPKTLPMEDYLALLVRCKEQALADSPVLPAHQPVEDPGTAPAGSILTEQLGLSEQEQKIVSFLRLHRKTSEMELRTLLGTRRIAGVVNRLVQKAASRGISLIAKKGMGEDGEIYEYIGS